MKEGSPADLFKKSYAKPVVYALAGPRLNLIADSTQRGIISDGDSGRHTDTVNRYSQFMVCSQQFSRSFTNDDARCHGIACRHPRQDRPISDAQLLNAVDPQPVIDDR